MSKNETLKLLAILSAFYGRPKAEAEDMANAWYVVLREYDYTVAEQACIEYAKNDNREYSQFPSVGSIVASIKEEYGCLNLIRNYALWNHEYRELEDRAKKWISEERFNRLKSCDDEYLMNNLHVIKGELVNKFLPEKT